MDDSVKDGVGTSKMENLLMGRLTQEPFNPSCCDGGECSPNDKSAQSCGCDPGASWVCERHREERMHQTEQVKVQQFIVKDSGRREEFSGGMRRDTTESKIDYTLVLDGPLIERLAEHLTKGAKKYDKRNWLKAQGSAEYERFRESAFRHFLQWYRGDLDEDHFAAVIFNLNGAEYVKSKLGV